ncbi:MAG: hypothetical protein GVY12_07830 [Bacteroidetes bacterium]|nr:hypothetical protein [Bacteroidota bacterium]
MSTRPALHVLRPLMKRAMEEMAEAYRSVEGGDQKRVTQAIATGKNLRAWQAAMHEGDLPPAEAASLATIRQDVARWWGKETELHEAVQDVERVVATFLAASEDQQA